MNDKIPLESKSLMGSGEFKLYKKKNHIITKKNLKEV